MSLIFEVDGIRYVHPYSGGNGPECPRMMIQLMHTVCDRDEDGIDHDGYCIGADSWRSHPDREVDWDGWWRHGVVGFLLPPITTDGASSALGGVAFFLPQIVDNPTNAASEAAAPR